MGGGGANGRLGTNTEEDSKVPAFVCAGEQNPDAPESPLEDIVGIAAAHFHSIAIDSLGRVWCWGASDYLGVHSSDAALMPVRVSGGDQGGKYLSDITHIGASYKSCIAIDSRGRVYTWGIGALGTGNANAQKLPTLISLPTIDGDFSFNVTATIENSNLELSPVDPNSDEVEITISITNPVIGDPNYIGDLTDVSLKIYLDEGLTYDYVDLSDFPNVITDPNYNEDEHSYTWQIATLNAGQTVTKTFDVTANKYAEPQGFLDCEIEADAGFGFSDYLLSIPVADWYEIDNDIIYVDCAANQRLGKGTSWEYPYVNLKDALLRAGGNLNTVSSDTEIWIAEGNYIPRYGESFEVPQGVELYGGFKGVATETQRSDRDCLNNLTTIYGYNSDFAITFIDSYSSSSLPAILDGLRITWGKDAGVYIDGHDVDISHCIISGNGVESSFDGSLVNYSGVEIHNAVVNVFDSIISYNSTAGVYVLDGGNVNINNSIISNNKVGLFCEDNNTLLDISNSVISYNDDCGVQITDNNTNNMLIRNCTMIENSNKAVKSSNANAAVTNSILWNNSDIANTKNSNEEREQFEGCSVSYSCVNNPNDVNGEVTGYDGITHNTQENPKFGYLDQDPNSIDSAYFAISSSSPCKDHGDNSDVISGEKDFYGFDRIYNSTVDMGAFEYSSSDVVNLADLNSDAMVNLIDFVLFASSWLSDDNDTNWNDSCDFDSDNTIDLDDLEMFAGSWLWQSYFLDSGTLMTKAHVDFGFRSLENSGSLPEVEGMSMMSIDSELQSLSCDTDDGLLTCESQVSIESTDVSTKPKVIIVKPKITPIKPAAELSDDKKLHEAIKTLIWLDEIWYNNLILQKTIDTDDWLDFRNSVIEGINDIKD